MKKLLFALALLGFAPLAQAQLTGPVQWIGPVTPSHCMEWLSPGIAQDSGGACGGGGGGGAPYSSVNTQSGTTYTLQTSDNNSLVFLSNTAAVTVTVPLNLLSVGNIIYVEHSAQNGTYVQDTFVGASGVTVRCGAICSTPTELGPGAIVYLQQISTNVWELKGFTQLQSIAFGNGICVGCVGPSGSTGWTNVIGQTSGGFYLEDAVMGIVDPNTPGLQHNTINYAWDSVDNYGTWEQIYGEGNDGNQWWHQAQLENWISETSNHTVSLVIDKASGYLLNATTASFTTTLVAAAYATPSLGLPGPRLEFCRTDNTAGHIATVAAAGTDKINLAGSLVSSINLGSGQCDILQADGTTTWYVVNSSTVPIVASFATASLPSCNSSSKGAIALASDTTASLAVCNGTTWVSNGTTPFTLAGTGCTPTSPTGDATGGSFTLAAGPCTSVTVTFNGAVGMNALHLWDCSVGDQTLQNAGTWFGRWLQSSSTTTTAVLPIPVAAGSTDVITFSCSPH